ncbi:MAG: magnesium transporter [Bacillota bacterium]
MAKIRLKKRNKPKEICHLVEKETRPNILKSRLKNYHPFDLSEALLMVDETARQVIYKHVEEKHLAIALSHLEEEKAYELLESFEPKRIAALLSLMEADDAVDIIQCFDEDDHIEIYRHMDEQKKLKIKHLEVYGKGTAGSEMNNNFIKIHYDMGVKEAMRILVDKAASVETIDTLFVVDDMDRLIGIVDLKDLIVAKHPTKIKTIMNTNVISHYVGDDLMATILDIQDYDILAMPIINDKNIIEGVITMSDALDIIESEAEDDYAQLAALPTEYDFFEPVFKSAKRRLPWLALLLGLNILVALVLNQFVETIDQVVALVMFQPLILGMAGNLGTQSLAVTVLKLAKSMIKTKKDVTAHIIKEFGVGLVNGVIIGILTFIMALTFLSLVSVGMVDPVYIAFVLGASVVIALMVSALLGSTIPLGLNRLGIDPAIASGPFITTLNDIVALIVYFSLAGFIILPIII